MSQDESNTQAPAAQGGVRFSEAAGGQLRLILNNNKNAVTDGRHVIDRYLAPRAYDARVINRLEVVFEELISNILRHGFTAHSSQSIFVTVRQEAGAIVLTFEDDGIPFDPLQPPDPQPFGSLETAPVGGLGISLVRKFSAGLRYERLKDEGAVPGAFAPRNRTIVLIAT